MSHRDRPARMLAAVLVAGAVVIATSIGSGGARAEVVDASSTTLLSGRADPRDGVVHTVVPVFELVSVRASDLHVRGFDDVVVVLSGWEAAELGESQEGKRSLGDLDIAFVEGKLWRRRVIVRAGRQLLVAGAGRNLAFDGLAVTVRPWRWVGVSAQGGVPVTPRFAADRGDALVAGRLFVKPAFDAEAGVSFLQVLDNGEIARRDLALDGRWVPSVTMPLTLSAFALASIPERRLGEGFIGATYQVGRRMEVSADYRRTAPDLFLPRNSIFSVFSQETRDEVGAYVYMKILPRLRLQGDYHVIVDAEGTGHDASAKLTGSYGPDGRNSLGVESRRLALPHTGYTLARAFTLVKVTPEVMATLDASTFFFDADVNGHRQSFVGAATLAYAFWPGWRAAVSGIGSVTPFAERRFEGIAKLVYQGRAQIRQVIAQGQVAP